MDARSFPPRSGWTNSPAHIRVLLLLAQQWTSSRLYSLWWSQFSFPFPEGLRLSLSRMASDPQSPKGSPESFFRWVHKHPERLFLSSLCHIYPARERWYALLEAWYGCGRFSTFLWPPPSSGRSRTHGKRQERPAPVQSTHNLLLFLPSQKSLLRISS